MKTKLLLLILFISSITINAIDGEFFIRLKNFGATWYTLKVEKIPSEFYYDANYNLATPPNLYFFRRSDSLFTIQADRVRDDSNNGTIDDNGNEFLIYYGIYKITIEYDQTECWFIIDYKDCDYSEYHYFDPDMYFYIDYQEAKIIKTNNNFNANHGDYTSATYKVYEDLKYDGYKYANTAFFQADVSVRNLVNQNDYGVINVDKNPINSGNSFHTTKGFTHEFETYSDVVQTDQRFREWNFDDATVKFQNPVNKQIPNADPVLARFYKIQPLTVINNLEGGGGGHYNLDWVGKSVTIDPINSGTAFNAFDYNLNEDEYHIIVAPTINVYNTNWNFLEWSDGVTSTTRSNERITSGNKNFTAYYKSWNRTDNTNTYSSNGQNRIVQTADGTIHKVYESLGKVWYEKSTNNGVDWTIMNNGAPISAGTASSSTIAVRGLNEIIIGFVEENNIRLKFFDNWNSYNSAIHSYQISDYANSLSLGWDAGGHIMLVYGTASCLKYWFGYASGNGISNFTSGTIPNTGAQSYSPSIVAENYSSSLLFHLVWQEAASIKYYTISGTVYPTNVSFTNLYDVSSALGYSNNTNPSIADYAGAGFIASWLTEEPVTGIYLGAVRPNYGTYWGTTTFTYSMGGGNDTESINANNNDGGGVIIGFGNNIQAGKYVKTSNLSSTYNQSYTGDVKVCNGSSYSDMLLSTLVTSSAPYQFKTYGSGGLPKTNNNGSLIEREINFMEEGKHVFVGMGNIIIDGENVGFYNTDSLGKTSVYKDKNLANYLVSEAFELNDKTELYFDFGIKAPGLEETKNISGKNAVVQLLLLEDETNTILGTVKTLNLNGKLTDNEKPTRFKLNSGLKNTRKAKLGMVIEGIDEKELNLTTKISGGEASLPKENINEITLENVNVVEEYNLVQNYPNPFNPSTIIKYQLPADGIVTLKVYDILGKEIKTLVNRKQSSGVYEVVFDASQLASGIYVYRLDIISAADSETVNYTSAKKMLLVK